MLVGAGAEDDSVLINVRTWRSRGGACPGARSLALAGDFERDVARPRDDRYVLYGKRSAQAADTMGCFGFTDVQDAGGLSDLAAVGAEVVTG